MVAINIKHKIRLQCMPLLHVVSRFHVTEPHVNLIQTKENNGKKHDNNKFYKTLYRVTERVM